MCHHQASASGRPAPLRVHVKPFRGSGPPERQHAIESGSILHTHILSHLIFNGIEALGG